MAFVKFYELWITGGICFRFGGMLAMYKSLMIQSSIYRTETGNTFARITTDAQICTNFCKALQGSSLKTI